MILTPETIEVGRKYYHKRHPGTVYLGCIDFESKKYLVIIKQERGNLVGKFVFPPNCAHHCTSPDFWNKFYTR